MKKVFAILIAALYLSVSTGLALEIHHCMGKIADISLIPSDEHSSCGKCGMAKGDQNCCKDELKFVKLQDSHKLINADYQLAVPVATVSNDHYIVSDNSVNLLAFSEFSDHSPPVNQRPSLCILYSVFRI